jgi:hypothetical protein
MEKCRAALGALGLTGATALQVREGVWQCQTCCS